MGALLWQSSKTNSSSLMIESFINLHSVSVNRVFVEVFVDLLLQVFVERTKVYNKTHLIAPSSQMPQHWRKCPPPPQPCKLSETGAFLNETQGSHNGLPLVLLGLLDFYIQTYRDHGLSLTGIIGPWDLPLTGIMGLWDLPLTGIMGLLPPSSERDAL